MVPVLRQEPSSWFRLFLAFSFRQLNRSSRSSDTRFSCNHTPDYDTLDEENLMQCRSELTVETCCCVPNTLYLLPLLLTTAPPLVQRLDTKETAPPADAYHLIAQEARADDDRREELTAGNSDQI